MRWEGFRKNLKAIVCKLLSFIGGGIEVKNLRGMSENHF